MLVRAHPSIIYSYSCVDANKLRDCLTFLTETPNRIKLLKSLKTSASDFEIRIYRLHDEDEPQSPYHAVVSVQKTPAYPQASDIYFGKEPSWEGLDSRYSLMYLTVYRDTDFHLGLEMPSLVIFSKGPSVRSPHYLSTMQYTTFPPATGDAPPRFRDVIAQPVSFKLSLKCPRHGETAAPCVSTW